MSAFSCPNCRTQLAAEGPTGQRLFCPTCRQEVETPPERPLSLEAFAPTPTALPPADAFRPRRPRREEDVYYDDGYVQVTGDGLFIGDRRYPLRHVVDVGELDEVREERQKSHLLTAGIVVGCLGALYLPYVGLAMLGDPTVANNVAVGLLLLLLAVPCLVLGVACALRSSKKVTEHAIVLIDHAGSEEEIWFRGKERRDKVFAALREILGPKG